MSIAMQGSWTIKVKSYEPIPKTQRFIIAGADSGNGIYDGVTSTPAVTASGDAWSITVQHKVGSVLKDSFEKITFPKRVGGQTQFEIQTNDDEHDPVFDDLILTCSTPTNLEDFIVYGNVSWYAGCWYTPCNPPYYVVIDTKVALVSALQRPALRLPIEKLYPAQVWPPSPNPPGPGPFRPLVIPVEGRSNIPAKQVQVFEGVTRTITAAKAEATKFQSSRVLTMPTPVPAVTATVNAEALAAVRDQLRYCETGPLPDYLLRFQEYDRTAAELAGGPYTGTGTRRTLGVATTDRNGNYIFRFTMSLLDFLDEAFEDTAPGENALIQAMPDVIVQVMEGTNVIYETPPNWNIPTLKRINVCVPRDLAHIPGGCVDGQIIQSIGNITVGPLLAQVRTTSNTYLGESGIITSYSSLGPQVRCAAWEGWLYLYACLNDPQVAYYTISYKRAGDDDKNAQFVTQPYSPYHVAPPPIYWVEQNVGPTNRNLVMDGVQQLIPSYFNIETDPAGGWMDRWKLLKVQLPSWVYEQAMGGPGSIEFRIKAYSKGPIVGGIETGTETGADDRITLNVDNTAVDQYLDPTVKMITTGGTVTQGNCALFIADPTDAPLEVTFRANQNEGFMDQYDLYMYKGAGIYFPIKRDSGGQISGNYTHNGDLTCSPLFRGTKDDATYGNPVPSAVTVDIKPASGNWLADTETFCAFSINLKSYLRVTDGQSIPDWYYCGPILIGIQKKA